MSKVGALAVRCLHGWRPSSLPAVCNPGVPASRALSTLSRLLDLDARRAGYVDLIAASPMVGFLPQSVHSAVRNKPRGLAALHHAARRLAEEGHLTARGAESGATALPRSSGSAGGLRGEPTHRSFPFPERYFGRRGYRPRGDVGRVRVIPTRRQRHNRCYSLAPEHPSPRTLGPSPASSGRGSASSSPASICPTAPEWRGCVAVSRGEMPGFRR